MKTFKVVFLLVFVSGIFYASTGVGQAIKTVESGIEITLRNLETGETYDLIDGEGITVETENGNLLKIVSFKLEEDHDLMNFEGPNRLLALSIRDEKGKLIVKDELAVLTRSGNIKFTFHINGAGNRLPVGWINK